MAAVAATAMIAGCGGGGGTESDNTETADDRTLIQVLVDDGGTLTARHSSARRSDRTHETTMPEQWAGFSVAWDKATENWTVTLDGLTHTFTDAEQVDEDGVEWASREDHGMYLYCWTCPDYTYLSVVSTGRNVTALADQETHGFAAIGLPTASFDNLPSRATYRSNTGPQAPYGTFIHFRSDNGSRGTRLWGDTELVADFTTQTLSGRLFDFVDKDDDAWDLILAVPETPFTSGGFSGHFDVSGFQSRTALLAYEGSLYGPEAQEIGGVISGTAVGHDETRYVTGGMFFGTQ